MLLDILGALHRETTGLEDEGSYGQFTRTKTRIPDRASSHQMHVDNDNEPPLPRRLLLT